MGSWLQRHQIVLYLASIGLGVLLGTTAPSAASLLESTINPLIGLLLFATFLSIPLTSIGRAFSDTRFLVVVLFLNFVLIPPVVWALSRFVADEPGLLFGVLLVLLTPCVDYVIVFAGLAKGDKTKLLSATPLLMLGQVVTLPFYIWLFAGSDAVQFLEFQPMLVAFGTLIVIPCIAAGLVQWWARHRRAGVLVERSFDVLMVPLLMATLAMVIGSQIVMVGNQTRVLVAVLPLYVVFAVVAFVLGHMVSKAVKLPVAGSRAVVFSGVTRNSLVVLPLALALPDELALAPLAVVSQTMVELVIMVIMVRWVPRLIADRDVAQRV